MLKKRLETIFITIIIIAVVVLINNWYSSNNFKNRPLSDEYKRLIAKKEKEILGNMRENYGLTFKVPLIVTDKFKNKLYGATSYKNGEIKIYLNKGVMQESMEYMLDSVIAHEYAHALMFKLGINSSQNNGHSKEWKEACISLGGLNCEQYVDGDEVVMSKMPF